MAAPRARVTIQHDDFDLGAEVAALRDGDGGVGAVADLHRHRARPQRRRGRGVDGARALPGHDRGGDRGDDRRGAAPLRHPRARASSTASACCSRGDQIVLVAVTSAHRGQAFQACEFLMDYLKTQAPFWKKEATAAGARWVDARVADDAALARWGIAGGQRRRAEPAPPHG